MVMFHLRDNKTACDHHDDYRNITCKVGNFNHFCVQTNSLHHCTWLSEQIRHWYKHWNRGCTVHHWERRFSTAWMYSGWDKGTTDTDSTCCWSSHVLAVLLCVVERDLCMTKLSHYSTHLYCRSRMNYKPQTAEVDKKMITEHQQSAMLTNIR